MGEMLELPEKLAKERLPRRSLAGTARPASAKAVLQALAKGLASKPYREKTYVEIFRDGLTSDVESSLMPERRLAFELVASLDEGRVARADEATLAVAEAMVTHLGRAGSAAPSRNECASLAPLVAAAHDLPTAVRIVARANRLAVKSDRGYPTAVHVAPLPKLEHHHVRIERVDSLRHLVCAADDAAYVAARAVAAALRSEASEWQRALIDYVFPDEPWANEDLASGLDRGAAIQILIAAASDASALLRYTKEVSAGPIADVAFDLVSVLAPADAIELFTVALARTLEKPSYGPVHKTPPRRIAQALACLAHPDATRVLSTYAAHPIVGATVVEHLRAHPELASASHPSGKSGALVAKVLEKRKRVVDAEPTPAASRGTLPILRERPWRKKVTVDGAPILVPAQGDERAFVDVAMLAARFTPRDRWPVRPMTDEERASYLESVKGDGPTPVDATFGRATQGYEHLEVPSEVGLALFNEGKGYVSRGHVAWVAKHGLAALPGFVRLDWLRTLPYDLELETFTAVRALVSPRIAPAIARAAQRKRVRKASLAWLDAHAEITAYGLVPIAVGPPSESRRDAEAALLGLARGAHEATVRAVARAYGADVEARIDALLARDPLALGASTPKPPSFLHVEELPPVRTRDGVVLDEDAVGALLEMMQVAPVEPRYAGIDDVVAACDGESLAAFARELLEQWVLGDAPGRAEWMLEAVVWFPSAAGDARVAEFAREWAQKNAAKAGRACGALARIGSDVAIMHLAHIAETSRFDALRKDAAALVAEVAAASGLTEDELADRSVPDAGLGPDGTIVLSLGAREVVVSVDAAATLVVRERGDDGALGPALRGLPRPRTTDDKSASLAARARLKTLATDVAAVAKRQIFRLERAMVSGRTWDRATFEARIVGHPLLGAIARGIVWERIPEAGEARAFRIAEDRSYAGADDAALSLPDGARVRIAHPARSAGLADFSGVFADYEIVQPFEQLGRTGGGSEHPGRAAATLEVASGHVAPAAKTLGTMESRGFRRDDPGFVRAYQRAFGVGADEVRVSVPLAPGISMESLAQAGPQTVGAATVADASGAPTTFAALDDVAFFEVVRDLEALRRLG